MRFLLSICDQPRGIPPIKTDSSGHAVTLDKDLVMGRKGKGSLGAGIT